MWKYEQSTGRLTAPDGSLAGMGYSGHGAGVNNPVMQEVPGVGPIPQGWYSIGEAYDNPERGPCVMRLTPNPGTNTFGRDGFLLHGDLVSAPGQELASLGCIIQGPVARHLVAASRDKKLFVTE